MLAPDAEVELGKRISFEALPPLTDAIRAEHVQLSLLRGLPEADPIDFPTLTVVANGPSARGVEFEGPCLALNGAHGLFSEANPPLMWAGIDPQDILAAAIKTPFAKTTYLVGSQCHPAVFDKLQGHDVRLWHVSSSPVTGVRKVPIAPSITLTALMLMQRLGWRRINVWGWDCGFGDDGSHHAGWGDLPVNVVPQDVMVGDRLFHTTRTWCCEANDALGIVPVLNWCGVEVNIMGDGFLKAVLDWKPTPLEAKAA